jgi:uncharacterized membrane protein YtjA (UPF0391 family)
MSSWILAFFIISLLSGVFGFVNTGIGAAGLFRLIFIGSLVIFAILVAIAMLRRRV